MGLKEDVALCFKEHNVMRQVLADWLDCADSPEEWARCRNNAKIILGRSADPEELNFKTHNKAVEIDGAKSAAPYSGQCKHGVPMGQPCSECNPPRNSL